MPLADHDLSIWDIAFRWTNLNPENPIYFAHIPLKVRDNIRLLLRAVSDQALYCGALSTQPSPYFPEGTLGFHAKELDACLDGDSYSRKFLKQIHIFRWDFARWCDEAGIPFPEFWFPEGWLADEPGYPAALRRPESTSKDAPQIASIPVNSNKYIDGKRADAHKNWQDLITAATVLRSENASLSIAEVIRKIKNMPQLNAAANTEGTIRKKIAHLWPDEERTPGRKPNKLG
jgi:hypothetical protein